MYKIILVDDEPSAISVLRRNIAKKADTFAVAGESYNCENAWKLMAATPPDILLTDIKMPGPNGLNLIGKTAQCYPDVVIIVISGYDDFAFVHDAFVYGVEDYLLKPINPAKFSAVLDNLKAKLENRAAFLDKDKKRVPAPERPGGCPAPAGGHPCSSHRLMEDIEKYVGDHIEEDLSISAVCNAFSISQPYLSKTFRKFTQCTFNEFVVDIKMKKAKELLMRRQNLLISTVAALAGFSDQFYFSKVFKSKTGTTPSEFRKKFEP